MLHALWTCDLLPLNIHKHYFCAYFTQLADSSSLDSLDPDIIRSIARSIFEIFSDVPSIIFCTFSIFAVMNKPHCFSNLLYIIERLNFLQITYLVQIQYKININ